MQISQWGNSLAVRIPADVVSALDLSEGDEIELKAIAPGVFEICRDEDMERARAAVRSLRGRVPIDFKFDREEANAR